jgi:uncharacterized protein
MNASIIEKRDVLSILHVHAEQIRELGVKRLGLFGSFVRNHARVDSDVDLLVEFEVGRKTYDNFIGLSFLLEEMLGRPVELVTRESLSPYIGPHILAEVEYVPFAA